MKYIVTLLCVFAISIFVLERIGGHFIDKAVQTRSRGDWGLAYIACLAGSEGIFISGVYLLIKFTTF